MIIIAAAFSLDMLEAKDHTLIVSPFPNIEDVQEYFRIARKYKKTIVSIVGHPDTASVFSSLLGFPVAGRRVTYTMQPGDTLIVGQYSGDRLPVGATELPPGATIAWWSVKEA